MEENTKTYLKDKIKKQIEHAKEEIKKSDEEIKLLEADLEVEKKMLGMLDIDAHLDKDDKESAKFGIEAAEGELFQEKEKNDNLKKNLKFFEYKLKVLESQF